jgi:hypothetical protein
MMLKRKKKKNIRKSSDYKKEKARHVRYERR